MKLLCENCHSDFYFEPSSIGDAVPFARCPQCDFPNPVPMSRGASSDDGQVSYAQCFNCGKRMALSADQAIPICPDCQEGSEKGQVESKEWMVKKAAGQIYGPFDLATLQAWITAYKIDPDDEVSKVGGQWKRFHSHPQFAKLFGGARMTSSVIRTTTAAESEPVPELPPAKPEGKKKKKKITLRKVLSTFLTLVATVATALGSYELTVRKWLIVPEPWIEWGIGLYKSQVGSRLQKEVKSASVISVDMSYLLTELKTHYPDVKEPSSTLYTRGRTLFLKDTSESLVEARRLLEMAVVANPLDDLALTSLAVIYAETGDSKLQQDALRLLGQADALNRSSAEVHRGRAAFAISTGQLEKVRTEASAALSLNPADGEAEYYIGISYLQPGKIKLGEAETHLVKAVEADPFLHKAFHRLAGVYVAQHEYRKAYQAYQKKLSIEPRNAQALADLGKLHEIIGEIDRAIEYYEKANHEARGTLPLATLDLAVLLYQARGQLKRARALLEPFMASETLGKLSLADQKRALVHLAAVFRLNGEASRCLSTLDRVLEIDPADGPALFQQGLAYYGARRLDEAGIAFRSAGASGGPIDAQSTIRLHLGLVLSAQDKAKAAVDEYRGAIEVYKWNNVARLLLINQYFAINNENEGLAVAVEGAVLDSYYTQDRAVRTLYYYNDPPLAAVVPKFREVAQKRFYEADSIANLGMLLVQIGNIDGAIATFKQAMAVNGDNKSALMCLGLLAYHQRQWQSAITLLNRLTSLHSQVGLAYVYLGLAYTEAGQYEQAEEAFDKALRYERTNPTLHDGLGVLLAKRGSPERAREEFLQAIALDSDFVPAHRHLFQYGQ